MREPAIHAAVHRRPDAVEAGVEIGVGRARSLVRAFHLRDRETRGLAHRQHLGGVGEGIRHLRIRRFGDGDALPARGRQFVGARHEAAADRIEGALGQASRRLRRARGRSCRWRGREAAGRSRRRYRPRDRRRRRQGRSRRASSPRPGPRGSPARGPGRPCSRRLARKRERNRAVGAVALAGEGERAVQADASAGALSPASGEAPPRRSGGRHHRPDGVRARRADADLEDIEDAEEHRENSSAVTGAPSGVALPATARDAACVTRRRSSYRSR